MAVSVLASDPARDGGSPIVRRNRVGDVPIARWSSQAYERRPATRSGSIRRPRTSGSGAALGRGLFSLLCGSAAYDRGMLVGRDAECERLAGLLERARAGRSGALVVRGEAGIGKTALLEWVAERADGFTVRRALGIES